MTNKTITRSSITIIAIVLLSVGGAIAQTSSATLQGTITDPEGRVIPGAKVSAQSLATGLQRQTTSNEAGLYVINFLPVGSYTVTVEAPSFKQARQQNVVLEIGQTRTLNVALEVGLVEQTVTIVDSAPPLDRNSATIGTVIQSAQIKELPLNGRNWAGLMLLAPGAINTGEGNHLSIRFVGRSRDDNNWTFDGVDSTGVKDPRQEANLRLVISTDSISEFRVNSTLYGADSGSGAGGQVQVVSRSGSNNFNGSVFEFLRNNIFDARVFTDPGKLPPFRLNQFGGRLGGPIRKDQTFFFFNYEGIRQRQGQTFRGFVPSAAYRAQVPSSSPLARIVNAYPVGTLRTSDANIDEVVTERKFQTREDSFAARIDHRFSDKDSIYSRYSTDDAVLRVPLDAGVGLRTDNVRPQNFVQNWQHIFSPNVINEAKFGFNRSPLLRIVSGPFDEEFTVVGFMNLENNQRTVEAGTSFSFIDNLAIVRGRHNLKFGGETRRIHVNVGEGDQTQISFTSRPDFIANRPNAFAITPFPVLGGRRWYHFGYAQDDFKVRPNLTLNLGVRYEYYSVAHEVKGRARVFDLACGGYCPAGSTWYFPDRNNFAPRLGLAWSPKMFKDRTVIRAGFGMFYGPGQVDDVFAALDSNAERLSLDRTQATNLSYPIAPFLALARTIGATPRALQRDRRDLYNESYSLTIQQNLPWDLVTQVGYIGGQGHQLFARDFINNINPATGQRPLPGFSRIDRKANFGNSNFNALQVSLHRQMKNGLLIGAQYMWSHSINDNSVGGGEAVAPQNVNNRSAERGNSAQDIRHTLTTNFIWELPFGQGRRFLQEGVAEKVFGGWALNGITQARTGRQLTISVTRSSADLPDGNNSSQRPDLVLGVPLKPAKQTADQWVNLAAFAVPPRGRWGTAGRSLLTGPGLVQFDLSLNKQFTFTESRNLEFRWEVFNAFNRAQYGDPALNLAVPATFGRITAPLNRNFGTGTNRQMQFALRLNF